MRSKQEREQEERQEAAKIKTGIREYAEEESVYIKEIGERTVIVAYNEGGYNSTAVDLVDVIEWVKENRPELLK
jgi:hypothetical protein